MIRKILRKYNQALYFDKKYFNLIKDKKYCLLIFLANPQKVIPFEVDKKGFGAMAAWVTVPNIDLIKRIADPVKTTIKG
jgi:hypothetical protein